MAKEGLEIKSYRLLTMYERLKQGKIVRKKDFAEEFNANERSVERDINSLRGFFELQTPPSYIRYDYEQKGYVLSSYKNTAMTNDQILAVCKIILETRSLVKEEMEPIINNLIDCCVSDENREQVENLIKNELWYYKGPHHGKNILSGMWDIGSAIREQKCMEIQYMKAGSDEPVKRNIKPLGIMFSEYYFYLIALLDLPLLIQDDSYGNIDQMSPTIYRIDRIVSQKVLDRDFNIPYKNKFEEGKFRNRVQFMHGGKLRRFLFRYKGPSIDMVFDRFPEAFIEKREDDGSWIVNVQVYGNGAEMWMRSMGDNVEQLELDYLVKNR